MMQLVMFRDLNILDIRKDSSNALYFVVDQREMLVEVFRKERREGTEVAPAKIDSFPSSTSTMKQQDLLTSRQQFARRVRTSQIG
jgi:hypothetical protein